VLRGCWSIAVLTSHCHEETGDSGRTAHTGISGSCHFRSRLQWTVLSRLLFEAGAYEVTICDGVRGVSRRWSIIQHPIQALCTSSTTNKPEVRWAAAIDRVHRLTFTGRIRPKLHLRRSAGDILYTVLYNKLFNKSATSRKSAANPRE